MVGSLGALNLSFQKEGAWWFGKSHGSSRVRFAGGRAGLGACGLGYQEVLGLRPRVTTWEQLGHSSRQGPQTPRVPHL